MIKKNNLKLLAFCSAVLISGNASATTTETFAATPTGPALISELGNTNSTPNPDLYPKTIISTAPFPVSISYPIGLWSNDVQSAQLRVCLADDLSTNFDPMFDSSREFADIIDIKDGSASTLDTEVEVFKNLFVAGEDDIPAGPVGDDLVETATLAGIENPNMLPSASSKCYAVDVTAMLNLSNSGTLSFNLDITDNFPDITPISNPKAFGLITKIAQDNGFPVQNPYHVWEDYVYERAELVVTYGKDTPVNVPTLSEWAMILLMLSLVGFAATRLKHT